MVPEKDFSDLDANYKPQCVNGRDMIFHDGFAAPFVLEGVPFVDAEGRHRRLPQEAVGRFIELQDTIYAHRRDELFKGRRTVAVSTGAKAGSGELEYYRIRQGDTLGGIARRYGVTVRQLREWNGLRNNNIRAGRRLKIYR